MLKTIMVFTLASLLALGFMTGCTGNEGVKEMDDGLQKPGVELPVPEESAKDREFAVEFETVDQDFLQGELKEKLGSRIREQGMVTAEDSGYTYIMISMGRRPTEGYSVTIGAVEGFEEYVVINAMMYSPCESDVVSQTVTYPGILIRIPEDEREILLFMMDTRGGYLG